MQTCLHAKEMVTMSGVMVLACVFVSSAIFSLARSDDHRLPFAKKEPLQIEVDVYPVV